MASWRIAGAPGTASSTRDHVAGVASSGEPTIEGNSFDNQGSVSVTNDATMGIGSAIFTNEGTVTVDGDSFLEIDGSLTNTGVINVAGTLSLGGTVTTAAVNSITAPNGTIELQGFVDNSAGYADHRHTFDPKRSSSVARSQVG